MKIRHSGPRTDPQHKTPPGRPSMSPGETEATRPRDHEDEVQKGPGSASADVQMTADGGTNAGAGDKGGKASR